MKRDKEGHYIMIKGSIQEEDITIINIYAPNKGFLHSSVCKESSLDRKNRKGLYTQTQNNKVQWDHTYQ